MDRIETNSIAHAHAQDENDKSGHLAKLYLRDLRMQAFMYKAASTWGPSFQCSATGKHAWNAKQCAQHVPRIYH